MEITYKFINHGIAYTYGNVIELNKNLLKYPKLMNEIIEHEKEHIKNNDNLFKDIITEIKDLCNFPKQRKLNKFIQECGETIGWESIRPIWIEKRGLVYNLPLICIYLIFALMGILISIII